MAAALDKRVRRQDARCQEVVQPSDGGPQMRDGRRKAEKTLFRQAVELFPSLTGIHGLHVHKRTFLRESKQGESSARATRYTFHPLRRAPLSPCIAYTNGILSSESGSSQLYAGRFKVS